MKRNVSVKTIDRSLKYQLSSVVGIYKHHFLMRLQGMDLNSFFVDAINREAIKVMPTPTYKTAFLAMALRQKLSRRSYKSNVNNISHCQAYFLKLKFPWLKIF